MKKALKILGIVLAAIILIPIFIFVGMHLFSSDIDSVDDLDLMVSVEIPEHDDNAYFDLDDLYGEIVVEYNTDEVVDYLKEAETKVHYGYTPGEGTVENFGIEHVEKVLALNNELINAIEIASEKEFYQNSQYENLQTLSFHELSFSKAPLPEFARIFAVKALYEFQNGDADEAVKTCLIMLKISKMIYYSKSVIIEKLIANGIYSITLDTLNYIIENGEFTAAQLKDYNLQIDDYKFEISELNEAYKVEYILSRNYIDVMNDINEPNLLGKILMNHDFYFKPEKTKQMLADNARGLIDGDGVDEEALRFPGGFWYFVTTENVFGKAAFVSIAPSVGASQKMAELNTKYEITQNLIDEKLELLESQEVDSDKTPVKRKD